MCLITDSDSQIMTVSHFNEKVKIRCLTIEDVSIIGKSSDVWTMSGPLRGLEQEKLVFDFEHLVELATVNKCKSMQIKLKLNGFIEILISHTRFPRKRDQAEST